MWEIITSAIKAKARFLRESENFSAFSKMEEQAATNHERGRYNEDQNINHHASIEGFKSIIGFSNPRVDASSPARFVPTFLSSKTVWLNVAKSF